MASLLEGQALGQKVWQAQQTLKGLEATNAGEANVILLRAHLELCAAVKDESERKNHCNNQHRQRRL